MVEVAFDKFLIVAVIVVCVAVAVVVLCCVCRRYVLRNDPRELKNPWEASGRDPGVGAAGDAGFVDGSGAGGGQRGVRGGHELTWKHGKPVQGFRPDQVKGPPPAPSSWR